MTTGQVGSETSNWKRKKWLSNKSNMRSNDRQLFVCFDYLLTKFSRNTWDWLCCLLNIYWKQLSYSRQKHKTYQVFFTKRIVIVHLSIKYIQQTALYTIDRIYSECKWYFSALCVCVYNMNDILILWHFFFIFVKKKNWKYFFYKSFS